MARKTPNQKEWERQIKRIERIVTRLSKEGITFIRSPIPEQPKRITQKQLSLISSLTKSTLKAVAKEEPTKPQKPKAPTPPKKRRKRGTKLEIKHPRPPMSEETKQKLSQKAKERWARKKAEQATQEPPSTELPPIDTTIPRTPTPTEIPTPIESTEPNPVWQVVLEAVRNRIMSANNRNIANYILRELESEIDFAEGGEQEVGMRLFQNSDLAIESADIIMYASSRDDLKQSAYALLSLIYAETPSPAVADSLDELAYADIKR